VSTVILLAQAASTLFMTGAIWIVQVVHYPLFAFAGREGFDVQAREHQRRITPVVGSVMLLEGATAVLLLLARPAGVGRSLPVLALVLLLAIWISTAFVQVPLHRRLSCGFDEEAISRLVATNWLRTVLWTVRSALVLIVLAHAIG
jgi:hypothetical protein